MVVLVTEGVTSEMQRSTRAKFELCDRATAEDWISGTQQQRVEFARLLRDPTCYAYLFFRHPLTDEPIKFYPYQDLIANDDNSRVLFAAANQIGKSFLLRFLAIHYAVLNPGATVLLVSATLPQSKDLLLGIRNLLRASVADFDVGDSDNKTEMYLRQYKIINGERREVPDSRIICAPATEGALGYSVDLALVDELGFYEDGEHFYFQILQPRTYHTKGRIVVFSNPNGAQGILWKLWNAPSFSKYRFTFLDCPANSQAEYQRLCEGLTQEQIDSTLDARFTDPEGTFVTAEERDSLFEKRQNLIPPDVEGPLFVFFDFAKVGDRTVRVTGRKHGEGVEVLEMYEYPSGTSYSAIVNDFESLVLEQRGKIQSFGWDNTGVGSGISDFISRIENLGVRPLPVNFSLQNKSRIYTVLKLLIERNVRGDYGIKVPYDKQADRQLTSLRFKRTARGYLQVHHSSEKDRDDYPDALAGLTSIALSLDSTPSTMSIVDARPEEANTPCRECGGELDATSFCWRCGLDNKQEPEVNLHVRERIWKEQNGLI